MLTGATSTGFAWEIEEAALDDMELLDALKELDDGKLDAVSEVCIHLLGKQQRTALYAHLRGENGRVKASEVTEALGEILNGIKDGKKS